MTHDMARPADTGRPIGGGGQRPLAWFLGVVALSVLLIAAFPVVWVLRATASGTESPTVEIRDQAGVVQTEPLAEDLAGIDFHVPVHLAVLTVGDVPTGTLNDAVLEVARTQPTDVAWIDPDDANYWADGLVILAVAPDQRLVGTYFGEDVAVSLDAQAAIQDAMKDDFRAADWAGGLVEGARTAAALVARPVWATAGMSVLAGVLSALGLGIGGWLGLRGRTTRRRFEEARTAYGHVTRDYDATEIAAGTIPTDNYYGAQVMARFADFSSAYHALTRSFMDLGAPSGATWYTGATRRVVDDLRSRATELDGLDDTILHANDLLTRTSRWRDAWEAEQGLVREDLASLESLADEVAASQRRSAGFVETGSARTFARDAERELDIMTGRLEDGAATPVDALAELDVLSDRIRQQATGLIRSALDADDSAEGRLRRESYAEQSDRTPAAYTGWWDDPSGGRHAYDPASTIRVHTGSAGWDASAWWARPGVWGKNSTDWTDARAADGTPTVDGASAPRGGDSSWSGSGSSSSFTPVSALVVGYSSAVSAASASGSGGSGGSSGGYGGGGFSGSGSSSSF